MQVRVLLYTGVFDEVMNVLSTSNWLQGMVRLPPTTTTPPHSTTPVFLNYFIHLCWVLVEVLTAFLVGTNVFFSQQDMVRSTC